MVQLQILSGRRTGTKFDSSSLPITLGRSGQSDMTLEEAGVWPSHCKIQWRQEGLVLEVEPGALASVNGTPMPRALLRNGDVITLGGVNLRFSFSPIQQSSAALREWLTWIALGALCLGQVAAIYWLNR
ncbi:MAG: FHA domain-containing protein [Limisphaerales bacterium]